MEEVTTKIFGFKVFAYMVEEAGGAKIEFQYFGLFPPWLAGWESLT